LFDILFIFSTGISSEGFFWEVCNSRIKESNGGSIGFLGGNPFEITGKPLESLMDDGSK